ncbi:phage holin family protein [Arsenophonus endosymbiont of Aleurodicus floccissimus]|uniref:phage holin family protein n=1 Tax=Arsenophonus endosymbiont of Aleurodicus floccissimus TaxID=2152761 RepID=UPI000E6AFE4F|nr:phage holin family protein [Arsenophonus endosymbiont of Aleurodicus floccissimus]
MNNIEKYTTGTAYSASATTFLFGALSLSDRALITGIICSFLTVDLNWYYRHKEYRLKVKEN